MKDAHPKLIVLLLLLSFVLGCKKEDIQKENKTNIVGTWLLNATSQSNCDDAELNGLQSYECTDDNCTTVKDFPDVHMDFENWYTDNWITAVYAMMGRMRQFRNHGVEKRHPSGQTSYVPKQVDWTRWVGTSLCSIPENASSMCFPG